MSDRVKLIIDTDPGQDIDDLLALAFALRRPELEICAITTVTHPSAKRARLVKRLLRHLDRTGIPVAAGMARPLRPMSEAEWRAQCEERVTLNHYAFAEPEDPRNDPGERDAVDLLLRTIDRHAGEIVLACIGPLTNIACLLQRDPSVARKICAIAMMGGELHLNRAEHNVAFDPVAAELVLMSGVPIVMGTWSVTGRLYLTMAECERLRREGGLLGGALADAIERWHPVQSWKPGPVLYDLFPIVWAFDRSFYLTEPRAVRVETRGEWTRGMTVTVDGPPNVEATVDLHVDALKDLFWSTLLSRL